MGKILRELCEWKKIKIVEAEVCPDHVHMLLEIPPKYSVSSVVGFLKGKSKMCIRDRSNMILIGKLFKEVLSDGDYQFCDADILDQAVQKCIPARKAQMLDFNRKAIQIGQEQ